MSAMGKKLSLVRMMKQAAIGAGAGVVLITALPICGAVGSITLVGTAIASVGGAIIAVIDETNAAA